MNFHTLLILYAELSVLWWMYAWLYYDYRTDLLRFRLFIIRDQLFDAAVKGELDFNSPAYKRTRTTLNGALRFAHRLTLSKLLITFLWMRRKDPTAVERHHEAMRLAVQGFISAHVGDCRHSLTGTEVLDQHVFLLHFPYRDSQRQDHH